MAHAHTHEQPGHDHAHMVADFRRRVWVAFGLPGMGFFWELVTLIDVMLIGH